MTRDEAFETLKTSVCLSCAYGQKHMDDCDIRYCDIREAIKTLEQDDFADFILRWLADVYDGPCEYDFAGIAASSYVRERDRDFCELHCGEHTGFECWKKFLELKHQEAQEKKVTET